MLLDVPHREGQTMGAWGVEGGGGTIYKAADNDGNRDLIFPQRTPSILVRTIVSRQHTLGQNGRANAQGRFGPWVIT